jgi:hypothetical protein
MPSSAAQPGVLQVSTGGGRYIGGPINTLGGAVILGDQIAGDYVAGDKVLGDKIYVDQRVQFSVEVYAVPSATPAERRLQVLQAGLAAFLPDRPFTVLEEPLFAGREAEKRNVLSQLDDPHKRAVLVRGAADVGKTSLLTAGVIPELERRGKLIIYQNDYSYPLRGLRGALVGSGARYGLALSPESPATQLASQVIQTSGLELVLILDQFERYYLPDGDAEERSAFRQELAQLAQSLEAQRLHVVFSIRDDLLSSLDREWADLLPDLRSAPVALGPLDFDQAFQAIITPIQALNGPGLDQKFKDQLLFDLDSLDKQFDQSISPADLQIVCYQLYQTARSSLYRTIDQSLYYQVSQNKGAEQIIDRHFDELATRLPEDRRALASEIAFNMLLDPELRFWFRPRDLAIENFDEQQVGETLQEMARAGLLIWHPTADQPAYAFASHSIRAAADRALGRAARQRLQASNELEWAWRAWLARDELPSPGALSFIAQHAAEKPLPAERALLLLRSATLHAAPAAPWLAQARGEPTSQLVREIEERVEHLQAGMQADGFQAVERLTRRQQARHVLGLTDERLPQCPPSGDFGPLAWAAATTPDPTCQETAALALLAAYGEQATARLDAAVSAAAKGRGQKVVLYGMLADADPKAVNLGRLPWSDRLRVWGWRARRRMRRDGRYIRSVAWGGALGAGLALALLRALLAALIQEQAGFNFYNYFPIGFFLGGGVALGLLLTNALLLRSPEHAGMPDSPRPVLPGMAFGSLGFAIGHFLLSATLRGRLVFEAPLITLMALTAGLGLAQAVRDQPALGHSDPSRRVTWVGWVFRVLLAALAFALVWGVFYTVQVYGVGLTYAWSADFYRYRLDDVLPLWGLGWIMDIPNWYVWPAAADAVLVGVALVVGLAAGMRLAWRGFLEWKSLKQRVRD